MAGNLRSRLGAALAGTAFVSVAITAVVSIGLVRSEAEERARRDLRKVAAAIVAEPADLPLRSSDGLGLRAVRRVLDVSGDLLAVVTPGGRIEGEGAEVARGIDLEPLVAGGVIEGTSGGFVYVGVPVAAGPRGSRAVVIARPIGTTRDLWLAVLRRVAFAASAALVVAAVVSAFLARRLAQPLRSLAHAAGRLARGGLGERVPLSGEEEVDEVAHAFNEMSTALAEAQRREREFLASVSHELKTPLTAIRGYAEALSEDAVKGEAARGEALAIIHAEAGRLERMVGDVMDLARLGAREFTLDVRPIDLAGTLRDSVAAHRAQAGEARVDLKADLPASLHLETDPDRIRQVVSNLVENALRVTTAGGTVRVGARADDSRALIEVSDTGPGIPAEDLPHVFERAYLWRASRGVRPVGTGLGLAIVRELVEALDGRVEVSSTIGAGTTFRVILPFPARDA